MTQVEDNANAKKAAAVGYADSAVASSQLEADIVRKQAAAEEAFRASPPPADDPFRADQWNRGQ